MVKKINNMFELKIIPYDKRIPPYRNGFYYCMCADHNITYSYNLVDEPLFHVKRVKMLFDEMHKDKKINEWLAKFSKENYETLHKGRNF